MIIQCEKCKTRFRLDDSRVTDKGVKVRCTKCKHVFAVRKEEPDVDSLPSGGEVLAEFPSPDDTQMETPTAPAENWNFATESIPSSPADSPVIDDSTLESEPAGFIPPEIFDSSEISFDTKEFEITAAESGDASTSVPTTGEFVFSTDDRLETEALTAPETSYDTISFDFEGDDFSEAMDVNSQNSNSQNGNQLSFDTTADLPFNLGEIDFGDELTSVAVQEFSLEDLNPSREMLFAPLAESTDKSADDIFTQSFLEEKTSNAQQVLPPLSIPSRRKQSPLFGVLISIVALLVISVLGYIGYSSFSTTKETASPESGKIGVRSVTSAFVANTVAGELLVVSGEAFNEYSKPRAALQIMVTVFDAAGQSVATKSAYGGNPLTEEQVKSLPLDKIEAAMANPFGDSLTNMGVAPGKSIPFVVVLADIPAGAKNFSVQSVGSTVATGK